MVGESLLGGNAADADLLQDLWKMRPRSAPTRADLQGFARLLWSHRQQIAGVPERETRRLLFAAVGRRYQICTYADAT